MEWTESLRKSIAFIENHLLDDITAEDVAREVNISSFYLQKGFKLMTNYSISEYIKNRRLYLAALELITEPNKVIDLAYKYRYETPESFSKAFNRFHGISPSRIRGNTRSIKPFLPLKITISIQGGNDMDYIVEKMSRFKVVGFEKIFSFEAGYKEIPKFWDEVSEKYLSRLITTGNPQTDIEKAILDNNVGMFGVCVDDIGKNGEFRYLIAGIYKGGAVPEGMVTYDLPDMEWAKFRCVGPMPGALQSVNTKIFKEWLPNNGEYKIAMGCNIEYYSEGNPTSADYESAIWVPVERI